MIRKRWIIAVALLCILSGSIGYVIAQTTLSIPYIMGGSYPGAPTYTIWTESSTTYAKNSNGQIEFSSSHAFTVFNDVKNSLMNYTRNFWSPTTIMNGKITVKRGLYDFEGNTLNFSRAVGTLCFGFIMEGEGVYNTMITTTGDAKIIEVPDSTYSFEFFELRNIHFFGDATSRTVGNHLLDFKDVGVLTMTDVYVEKGADAGCYVEGGDTYWIRNCAFRDNYGVGLALDTLAIYSHVTDCDMSGNALAGISSTTSASSFIGNRIWNNTEEGITAYGPGYGNRYIGNFIQENGKAGLVLSGSPKDNIISGNYISANSQSSAGTYSGILLSVAVNCTITGNDCTDTQATETQLWGILEDGACDYNLITSNHCIGGYAGGGIFIVGANTEVHQCFNGTTFID